MLGDNTDNMKSTKSQIGNTTAGRPRTRVEPLGLIGTRCPEKLHQYIKGLAVARRMSQIELFTDMLELFLSEKPWTKGLPLTRPKAASTEKTGTKQGGTASLDSIEWVPVQIKVNQDLANRIVALAAQEQTSKAAIGFTAIYWYCEYIHHPRTLLQAPPRPGKS